MASKQSILIPDTQTRAMLAALRSLGRAGYDTHAISEFSDAMGLGSRFAKHATVSPPYRNPNFQEWLRNYCRDHAIEMIVPSGGILEAIRPSFDDFKHLLPISDSPEIAYRAGNKIEAFNVYCQAPGFQGLLDHHPRSIVIKNGSIPDDKQLSTLGLPVFIKASERDAEPGFGDTVNECQTTLDVKVTAQRLFDRGYRQILIQAGVHGTQVAVSALMSKSRPLLLNCVRDSYPTPHSKGTMSLRHTWWNQEIVDDAVNRLRALEWEGCAMVEYRWSPETGEFNVIEINARFWQYLHLDIHAGADFPRSLAEWFLEGLEPTAPSPKQGVTCRDLFPGEVAYLANTLRNREMSLPDKALEISKFIFRLGDPRIHSDLLFPGDRMIYFRELRKFLTRELTALNKKIKDKSPHIFG